MERQTIYVHNTQDIQCYQMQVDKQVNVGIQSKLTCTHKHKHRRNQNHNPQIHKSHIYVHLLLILPNLI